MKKRISILVCLLIFNLACLSTAARLDVGEAVPVPSAEVRSVEVSSVEVAPSVEVTATRAPKLCAVVTAETAVHLRAGPSATAAILNHLRNGEELEFLGDVGGSWWHVKRGGEAGYVRADYLELQECEK